MSVSVEFAMASCNVPADRDDLIALDGDIASTRRTAGAVDHHAIANHQISVH
jgi:hypothetical protein